MPDYGHRYADKKLSEVDRKLKQTYKQAQRELKRKLASFNKRFEAQCKRMRRDVLDGKISKQDYKDWLAGRVFVRQIWKDKINQVNAVLNDHNNQSVKLINKSRLSVFAENYNYMTYIAEGKIAASFTLYNAEAIAKLLTEEPDLLPKWDIDKKKDYKWNYQKVNNIVTQGIIQGESIPHITERLCEDLCTQNENRMRMFARTAITGAENAGRQEQMNNASAMGIKVRKRWEATHDSRTRDSHRSLDGEEVPYDEEFSNGLEYPGDPSGDPEEVYNCRCTMVSIYPEYEDYEASKQRYESMEIEGQSYRDWKAGKKESKEISSNVFKQPYFEYMKGLIHSEAGMRSAGYESAACIDRETGKILFNTTDNQYGSVHFTNEQMALMQDQTMTHNHPDGYTFSPADIKTSMIGKAREIRICHEFGDFSLERMFEVGEEVPAFYLEFADDYEAACKEFEKKANEAFKGEGDYKDFAKAIDDDCRKWLKENAKKYGWRYKEEWMR